MNKSIIVIPADREYWAAQATIHNLNMPHDRDMFTPKVAALALGLELNHLDAMEASRSLWPIRLTRCIASRGGVGSDRTVEGHTFETLVALFRADFFDKLPFRNQFGPDQLGRKLEYARVIELAYGQDAGREEQYTLDVITGRQQ